MAKRSNHPAVFAGLLGSAAWGLPQIASLIPAIPGGSEAVGSLVNQFLMGCVGGAAVAGAVLYGHDIVNEMRERREEGEQLLIARGGAAGADETAIREALVTAEAVEAKSATGADDDRVVAPKRKANHPAQPSPAAHHERSESHVEPPVMKSIPTRDSADPLVARAMRPATHRSRSMTSVGYPLATRIPEIDATAGPAQYAAPVAQAGYPPYGSGRWSTGNLDAAREQARAEEAETTGDLGRARMGKVTIDESGIVSQQAKPGRRFARGRHSSASAATPQGGGRHFSSSSAKPQAAPQAPVAAHEPQRATDDTFAQLNMQSFGVRDASSQARSQSVNQVLADRLGSDALGIVSSTNPQRRSADLHRSRFTGEGKDRASYIASHVAEVNEGVFPERRSVDDLDSHDAWEEALSAMGENLGQRSTPVFHDAVGGPGTIDEPDGLEGPTGFIPFRVPAAHPEVVDTPSYVDYLLRDEFSQNSSKALHRSARSHLRVIEGGTMPIRLRRMDNTSARSTARHFAPTDFAKEA